MNESDRKWIDISYEEYRQYSWIGRTLRINKPYRMLEMDDCHIVIDSFCREYTIPYSWIYVVWEPKVITETKNGEYTPEQVVVLAKALCEKFIKKVESGRARSRETYDECKDLLKIIEEMEKDD